MLKERKTLFIMGIILIVGCGAFFTYRYQNEMSATVKIQDYVGYVFDLEEVVSIDYIDEETIKIDKHDGIWSNPELSHLKYNQDLVNQWIMALKGIETKEMIKNVQDETAYGIDESSMKITLYDESGQQQTIQIGNTVEAEDSIYLKTNEKMYSVSYEKLKDLLISPNRFVDCREVLEMPEIQTLHILYKDKEVQMSKQSEWLLENYYALTCILDEEVVNELINTLKQAEIINYVGSYKELGKYDLASPQLVATVNENLKLAFGKQGHDGVYVTINDGQDVYLMEKSVYQKLVAFNAYDAMNKQVLHLDQNEISEIILSNPQGTYHFSLNLQTTSSPVKENESSEETEELEPIDQVDEGEQVDQSDEIGKVEQSNTQNNLVPTPDSNVPSEMIVAKLNDRELNQEEANEWFNKIQESLWIEAPLQNPNIEQKEERKAEAQMSYVLKDASKIDIELIPYDINYYILRYNGVIEFAVNKERITKVFNELTSLTK